MDKNNDELISQLTEIVGIMTTSLKRLMSHHDFQEERLTLYRCELNSVREHLSKVTKALYEGNGERALLTRVALLENSFKDLENDLAAIVAAKREEERLEKEKELQNNKLLAVSKKGKWQLGIALVTAISGILTAYFKYFH